MLAPPVSCRQSVSAPQGRQSVSGFPVHSCLRGSITRLPWEYRLVFLVFWGRESLLLDIAQPCSCDYFYIVSVVLVSTSGTEGRKLVEEATAASAIASRCEFRVESQASSRESPPEREEAGSRYCYIKSSWDSDSSSFVVFCVCCIALHCVCDHGPRERERDIGRKVVHQLLIGSTESVSHHL